MVFGAPVSVMLEAPGLELELHPPRVSARATPTTVAARRRIAVATGSMAIASKPSCSRPLAPLIGPIAPNLTISG